MKQDEGSVQSALEVAKKRDPNQDGLEGHRPRRKPGWTATAAATATGQKRREVEQGP